MYGSLVGDSVECTSWVWESHERHHSMPPYLPLRPRSPQGRGRGHGSDSPPPPAMPRQGCLSLPLPPPVCKATSRNSTSLRCSWMKGSLNDRQWQWSSACWPSLRRLKEEHYHHASMKNWRHGSDIKVRLGNNNRSWYNNDHVLTTTSVTFSFVDFISPSRRVSFIWSSLRSCSCSWSCFCSPGRETWDLIELNFKYKSSQPSPEPRIPSAARQPVRVFWLEPHPMNIPVSLMIGLWTRGSTHGASWWNIKSN